MSHHIYQTKAFVIDSADVGEANKLLSLFTADLGFVMAAAQGVRLVQSKLRQSIQDMSFSKVSLVRGKEVWRLTNAEKLISLYDKRIPLSTRRLMARVLAFLKRLLQGESKHEELFNFLSKFCDFCLKNKEFSQAHAKALETFAEARILHELGYGSDEEIFKNISNTCDDAAVLYVEANIDSVKKHVTMALQGSHL